MDVERAVELAAQTNGMVTFANNGKHIAVEYMRDGMRSTLEWLPAPSDFDTVLSLAKRYGTLVVDWRSAPYPAVVEYILHAPIPAIFDRQPDKPRPNGTYGPLQCAPVPVWLKGAARAGATIHNGELEP